MNQVLEGDCLELLKQLPDNSVDLICTDPPFFGVKGGGSKGKFEWWDRQWKTEAEFIAWMRSLALEWRRVLKPNGSLYVFASTKMAAKVEVMLGEIFCVLSNIRWKKEQGRHKSACKEGLRGFFNASESIIFCEHYGADNIAKGEAGYGAKCDELRGFVFEPLRAYLDGERRKLGISSTPFDEVLGSNGLCKKYFNLCQWQLPTAEGYKAFQKAFPGYFTRPHEELRQQYEELRQQYEELRQQYEELRRPFSVAADVPYTDVWTFATVQSYKGKHPCEKPMPMLEHIISASSRPGAVVLDCFGGSGNTAIAAKNLGRNYMLMEIDPHWENVARGKLGESVGVVAESERERWLRRQTQQVIPESSHRQLDIFEAIASSNGDLVVTPLPKHREQILHP